MSIVAEEYTFVIGVDTHAATHSLALLTAATGAVVDQAVFPNTPPGLDRALNWITHRIGGQPALVVIEGVGSYGAGLAQRMADAGLLVAEPSAMPAAQRRGVGKTDALDAVRIGRSILAVDTSPGCGGPEPPARVWCYAFWWWPASRWSLSAPGPSTP